MLIDKETLLSDEQAVTATAFSANQYDTGGISPTNNRGRQGLRAVFTTSIAALAAGAATVTFEIGEADDAAGTNFRVLASSGPIGKADLTIGSKPFDIPLPDTNKRFLLARYTVATGPLTAGKFSCALVCGSDHQRAYADGYNSPAS